MNNRFTVIHRCLLIAICVSFLAGCGHVAEFGKGVWGSSTRALEEARVEAITHSYECDLNECFEKVLTISEDQEYEIFISDRTKKVIVVMGVKGSVDTTEVGIFFSPANDATTVEITSLSSNAKRTVANAVFSSLAKEFKDAP